MNQLALYQIAEMYRDAVDKLSDMDLPAESVNDTLAALQGELQLKAVNVVGFCRNLESLAESIKDAEEKMSHRRKVIENRVASIKSYVKTCMESAGIQKIESPHFKISLKKNPPSVEITNESILQSKYMKEIPPPPSVPDKKLIAEDLKNGINVEGARLNQSTRLSIE